MDGVMRVTLIVYGAFVGLVLGYRWIGPAIEARDWQQLAQVARAVLVGALLFAMPLVAFGILVRLTLEASIKTGAWDAMK